eukprot:gene260-50644_t
MLLSPAPDYGLPVPNLLTQLIPSPAHRWYYFPGLLPDEVLAVELRVVCVWPAEAAAAPPAGAARRPSR